MSDVALLALSVGAVGAVANAIVGRVASAIKFFGIALLLAGGLAFGPQILTGAAGVFTAVSDGAVGSGDSSDSAADDATAAEAEPVDTMTAAKSGSDVPWGTIGAIAAASVGGGVVLAGVGAVAIPAYRRRRDALKAQRVEQAELLEARNQLYVSLVMRHEKVKAAYNAFLLDIFAVLERPALNDVMVSTTAAFLDAHARAADVRPEGCPAGDAPMAVYELAVRDLDHAWAAADAHARRVGTGLLAAEERRKVSQAVRLLTTARDGAATPAERHACYKRATALLDGIIVLPTQTAAALEIEAGKTLALTA